MKQEIHDNKDIMVSIPLLTYNQKNYLGQCLDSVLKQKVNFKIEVLVGDDCSTDGTQDVMREYEEKYPGVFTMIYRKKNLGVTGNLYDLLKRCKGKYIAGLEGDDYWIDANKLQKQVMFMEKHPEFVGCSHEVQMIDENGNVLYNSGKYIEGRHWTFYKSRYTWKDFQKFQLPGQGSTYMYRNIFIHPQYDYSIIEKASSMIGDMTLLMLYTAIGDWYFAKGKVMTCYRCNIKAGSGSWSSWALNGNRCYHNFMFRYNLEEYARKVLHKSLNLSKDKFNYLYEARCRYLSEPTTENRKIYYGIWKHVKNKPLWMLKLIFQWNLDKYRLRTVAYAYRTGELNPKDKRLKNGRWSNFMRDINGRTVVAFGDGVSFEEFLKKYGKRISVPIVLDNGEGKWGRTRFAYKRPENYLTEDYEFADCRSPECIKDWNKDRFVILITSTLYQDEIAEQLKKMGFHRYYSFGNMEIRKWYYRLFKNYKI